MAYFGEYSADSLPQGNGGNFDPIPDGWYTAAITAAELKTTKDGTGQYIKLRYDVTGPSFQGRVVFGNLNIKNQSAKSEEIGRQQMGEVMRAIGLSKVSDTDQFVGGHLQIKVTIKPAEGQYQASNEVKGFKALSSGVQQMQKPASVAAPQAAAAGAPAKAAPPWAKK